mmetsp:Transcript_7278/g.23966  ORF Transcript_7278/g.23966 Transcript_7278/m.23966 type:complete len:317 (+) Transcript_7278:756-1706(+)
MRGRSRCRAACVRRTSSWSSCGAAAWRASSPRGWAARSGWEEARRGRSRSDCGRYSRPGRGWQSLAARGVPRRGVSRVAEAVVPPAGGGVQAHLWRGLFGLAPKLHPLGLHRPRRHLRRAAALRAALRADGLRPLLVLVRRRGGRLLARPVDSTPQRPDRERLVARLRAPRVRPARRARQEGGAPAPDGGRRLGVDGAQALHLGRGVLLACRRAHVRASHQGRDQAVCRDGARERPDLRAARDRLAVRAAAAGGGAGQPRRRVGARVLDSPRRCAHAAGRTGAAAHLWLGVRRLDAGRAPDVRPAAQGRPLARPDP